MKTLNTFNPVKKYNLKQWHYEAIRRFGHDHLQWRFICPACKREASMLDYFKAKANPVHIPKTCLDRFTGGPCTHTGVGVVNANPVLIKDKYFMASVFDFAETR